jgi:iron complex transport system ATP-binding protein
MSSIIKVANISFGYMPERKILNEMSFEVRRGEFLAIAGPNGAGKSTLLNLISGGLRPESGAISIDGKPVDTYSTPALAEKVAMVRQEFVPIFDFTVAETVMMARTPYFSPMGFETKVDREIVSEALRATETAQLASRPLRSLSSGERQRVFIARALAQDTTILLLDEPTSFLDLRHQVAIYDLLKMTQLEKSKTIVAVTHDLNLAAQYCDDALLLAGPAMMSGHPNPQDQTLGCSGYSFGKPADVFSPEKIEKIFGVKVFSGSIGRERFLIPLGKFAKDA